MNGQSRQDDQFVEPIFLTATLVLLLLVLNLYDHLCITLSRLRTIAVVATLYLIGAGKRQSETEAGQVYFDGSVRAKHA